MGLKDNTLFIAVGQAGGNICQRFVMKGYKGLALNTSQQDLDTLEHVPFRYHVPGGEGCSKMRSRSKAIFKEHFDDIIHQIEKVSGDGIDNIFTVFSAGGGTGSGAGPALTYHLANEYDNANVGIITVLPSLTESPKANNNAYECFREIARIDEMQPRLPNFGAVFVLDNMAFDNRAAIDACFADDFDELLGVPERDKSKLGNIDTSEIKTLLRAPGMAVIAATPDKDNTTAALLHNLKNSIYAPISDDGIAKYIALSLMNAGENAEDIAADLQKAIGRTEDIFTTYNNAKRTLACISGLSYPAARLEQIYQQVKAAKSSMKEKASVSFHDDLADEKPKAKEQPKKSRAAIFDLFEM